MARVVIRKTASASASGGGKINVRGREWTKENLRELKNHSRENTPVTTVSKLMKRTEGALWQKAYKLGLPLGRSSREWTKGDLEKLLPRPIVGSSGVNANESKQEQSGIIRSQFRGDRGATAIFRGAQKEDVRELKRYARQKTPASTIAKSMKRTVFSVRRKALTMGLSLGHPARKWTTEDLLEFKSYLRQKTPTTTIAKSMRRTVGAVREKARIIGMPVGRRQ